MAQLSSRVESVVRAAARRSQQAYKIWKGYSRPTKATLFGFFVGIVSLVVGILSLVYAAYVNIEASRKEATLRATLEEILSASMMPYSDIDTVVERLAAEQGITPEEVRLEIVRKLGKSSSLYDQGLVAFLRKDFPKAVEYLEGSIDQARSDLARRYFYLGNALYYSGDFEGASSEWENAIKERPNMVWAHFHLGNTYAEMGQQDLAIKKFHEVLRVDPSFFYAHLELGNIYYSRANLKGAKAEYGKIISINDGIWWAYFNLGGVYYKEGSFGEAVRVLQRAAVLMSDAADSHVSSKKRWAATVYARLGAAQVARGDLKAAAVSYQTAISMDKDYAAAYYNFANLKKMQGEIQAAQGLYQRAIAVDNSYTKAYINLAGAYADQGKFQAAKTLLESSLPRFLVAGDLSTIYYNLGDIDEELGDNLSAARNYMRAIALEPEDRQSYVALLEVLRERGLTSEAQSFLGSVLGVPAVKNLRDAEEVQ